MTALDGHVLTPDGFIKGRLTFDGSRIAAVSGNHVDEAVVRESALPMVIPGFVDLHVHGGGGADVMDGGDAALHVARTHVRTGTTMMLATTMTAPEGDLSAAFSGVARAVAAPRSERAAAHIFGVHLEGPYISDERLGAQPNFTRRFEVHELRALNAITPIRLITLAPELSGNLDAIPALVASGYKVQLGHSNATYEQTKAALDAGAVGFTHLYNAMSALHHRQPGMVGAALAHAHHAEIIVDLLHVHPGAIHAAMRNITGLYCVTDSTAAASMPDGEYQLGRQRVTRCMGGVRLADGTLAGSVLTMDQAFRNLVEILGLSLADASRRTSTVAADYIGASDRGRLTTGAFADVVVLNRDLKITEIFAEGVALAHAN
ncbi:MAG TPA: N-acetylglucosamine-6-phosphate deacetylase [Casimicrobium sp.]|jgi:N-acetylglucosamine-6-phosphate deacetylase|nr:N-acetylglucosamine-6-phosphate deacetylase [Casimicrobium sp.]